MSFDPDRIQALCFDVDGTLSDTDDHAVERLARLLMPLRFLLPGRDAAHAARRLVMWVESPGNALMGLPDRFGLDDELIALVDWLYRHRDGGQKHFLLVPEVGEMLEALHRHYPMAVVSARREKSTLAFLALFNLRDYFQVVVTALTCEHTKPYPHPVLHAARAMGVDPQACLMIGDTTVDMRAGKAAGAQTVGVLCGFGEEDELRRTGADLILESTAQLAEVLLGRAV
jgi:N-acetyl-D-muramate 6-phosphate phosphatase